MMCVCVCVSLNQSQFTACVMHVHVRMGFWTLNRQMNGNVRNEYSHIQIIQVRRSDLHSTQNTDVTCSVMRQIPTFCGRILVYVCL